MDQNINSSAHNSIIHCHVCKAFAVEIVSGYEKFRRVTSDCMPWPSGGRIGVCLACGCIQKVIDNHWQTEAEQIYRAYNIYHQAKGAEPSVFYLDSGLSSVRSVHILEHLLSCLSLPEKGRMLDVGCGNGAMLRAFSRIVPFWSLVGTELNDKHRIDVESIERVEKFYLCAPEHIPGTFNLITMIYVLEHIVSPLQFLIRLREKIEVDGLLLVEVPDHMQNPFDLLITDHCSHFTETTLTSLLRKAGYEIVLVAADWVPKELSIVARQCYEFPQLLAFDNTSNGVSSVKRSLQWLEQVVATAFQVANKGRLGIFGTSIAATWLYSELEDVVSFFVDEDPNQTGKSYFGHPVYHPSEVTSGSHVFVPLPPILAGAVTRRLAHPAVKYYCTPALPSEI